MSDAASSSLGARNQRFSSLNLLSRLKPSSSLAWPSTASLGGTPVSCSSDFKAMSSFTRCHSVPRTAVEEADVFKRLATGSDVVAGLNAQNRAEDARGHTQKPTYQPTQRQTHEYTAPQSPRETYIVYSDTYWRVYARDQHRRLTLSHR
jgi:hypothetical protein